ncbi:MAG: hypothetical protein MJ105_07895 [Lachnospiraceae bacterium]|nr:hypothetical protein [Lachnospiraceae bacterium]
MCDCETKCCACTTKENKTAVVAAFAIGLVVGFLFSPIKKGIKTKITLFSNNRDNGSNNGSKNGSKNGRANDHKQIGEQ